jgi:probable rRNA maturation factor
LRRLFGRAWGLIPEKRRAAVCPLRAQSRVRLAVDLHVVSDTQIAGLNRQHMGEGVPTDVLAFPLGDYDPERRAWHLGEIVVSFETARREAIARGLRVEEELSRYCVHGFLHLCGFPDKTPATRRRLEAIQEGALRQLFAAECTGALRLVGDL